MRSFVAFRVRAMSLRFSVGMVKLASGELRSIYTTQFPAGKREEDWPMAGNSPVTVVYILRSQASCRPSASFSVVYILR